MKIMERLLLVILCICGAALFTEEKKDFCVNFYIRSDAMNQAMTQVLQQFIDSVKLGTYNFQHQDILEEDFGRLIAELEREKYDIAFIKFVTEEGREFIKRNMHHRFGYIYTSEAYRDVMILSKYELEDIKLKKLEQEGNVERIFREASTKVAPMRIVQCADKEKEPSTQGKLSWEVEQSMKGDARLHGEIGIKNHQSCYDIDLSGYVDMIRDKNGESDVTIGAKTEIKWGACSK